VKPTTRNDHRQFYFLAKRKLTILVEENKIGSERMCTAVAFNTHKVYTHVAANAKTV